MLSVFITLLKKFIFFKLLFVFNFLKIYFNPNVDIAEFDKSSTLRDLFPSRAAANFNIKNICTFIDDRVNYYKYFPEFKEQQNALKFSTANFSI